MINDEVMLEEITEDTTEIVETTGEYVKQETGEVTLTLSALAFYEMMDEIARDIDIDLSSIQMHPILPEGHVESPGLIYLYACDNGGLPESSLMLAAAPLDIPIFPNEVMELAVNRNTDNDEEIQRTINLFGSHPDPLVSEQIYMVTKKLLLEGYVVRTIAYRDAAKLITPNLDINTITGSLYPLLHFINRDTLHAVMVNCAPLINKVVDND